jgi:hypothetical protein
MFEFEFFMNCHRASAGGLNFNNHKALAEIIKANTPYCFS